MSQIGRTFAQSLKARREAKGLSARELSRRASDFTPSGRQLNEKTVQNIEAGTSEHPRIDTAVALAHVLGCTLDQLVNPDLAPSDAADANPPALSRKIVWNVAYSLAENSPVVDAPAEAFADTFLDLCDTLTDRPPAEDRDEGLANVIDFASRQLQAASRR